MSLLDALLEDELVPALSASRPIVVFIRIRSDNAMGSGTLEDPYNGASDTMLDKALDVLIPAITGNVTIDFGPGVFRTKGFGAQNRGWVPRSGQTLRGAGIDQTVLQLVNATGQFDTSLLNVGVIHSDVAVNSVEIKDMTIDVNLARQPLIGYGPNVGTKSLIKGQAIELYGTNLKVRRVRVINWGTYRRDAEDFPIFLESPDFYDTGHNLKGVAHKR